MSAGPPAKLTPLGILTPMNTARSALDLTATIEAAVKILWSVGFACGYTHDELEDIENRIKMKASYLTRRLDDEKAARDPYRLVSLAMNDLCRQHDRWYSLFYYLRLRANQRRYCKQWNWNDRRAGVARTAPLG